MRTNLKNANLTKGDMIEILPFFNNLVIVELPGHVIMDALEFGVKNYPKAFGGFLQPSSELSYTINPDINSSIVMDASGLYQNISGPRRISNVKVNGENLKPEKKYNVAMIEYHAKGGDGYTMLADYEITKDALVTDTHALSNFIENNLKGELPEKYSKIQGRIKITNESDKSDQLDKSDEPDESDKSNKTDGITRPYYKKSEGLSTGVMVAIIVPCIVVLLAMSIVAIILRKSSSPSYNLSSVENVNKIYPN